jgi:hypothetical protein
MSASLGGDGFEEEQERARQELRDELRGGGAGGGSVMLRSGSVIPRATGDTESEAATAARRRAFLSDGGGAGTGGSVMFRLEPAAGRGRTSSSSPSQGEEGQGPPSSGGRRARAQTQAFKLGAAGTPLADYEMAGAGVESPHLPQIQHLGTQLGLIMGRNRPSPHHRSRGGALDSSDDEDGADPSMEAPPVVQPEPEPNDDEEEEEEEEEAFDAAALAARARAELAAKQQKQRQAATEQRRRQEEEERAAARAREAEAQARRSEAEEEARRRAALEATAAAAARREREWDAERERNAEAEAEAEAEAQAQAQAQAQARRGGRLGDWEAWWETGWRDWGSRNREIEGSHADAAQEAARAIFAKDRQASRIRQWEEENSGMRAELASLRSGLATLGSQQEARSRELERALAERDAQARGHAAKNEQQMSAIGRELAAATKQRQRCADQQGELSERQAQLLLSTAARRSSELAWQAEAMGASAEQRRSDASWARALSSVQHSSQAKQARAEAARRRAAEWDAKMLRMTYNNAPYSQIFTPLGGAADARAADTWATGGVRCVEAWQGGDLAARVLDDVGGFGRLQAADEPGVVGDGAAVRLSHVRSLAHGALVPPGIRHAA